MQTKHESILRAVNNKSKKYNILTFPVHEAYQSNLSILPHTFYLLRKQGVVKDWNFSYRPLPKNHILLDGTEGQIRPDMIFDIALSQNKFGNYQTIYPIAKQFGIPLINIEHTLPPPTWSDRYKESIKEMRGDINIFISEYSVEKWGWSLNDPSVRIIHHGINTNLFTDKNAKHNDGKVLSVVNDWINRDWCCNFSTYKKICLDRNMPINPVGDTPNFSKAAKDINELVSHYQNASVFINTSTISPVPTALMEAMACGCPVVTTATCMIPDIVKDGYNGFISNDEEYLYDKLNWCVKNPDEAREIGNNARKTILERFTIEKHIQKWSEVFDEVYGKIMQ